MRSFRQRTFPFILVVSLFALVLALPVSAAGSSHPVTVVATGPTLPPIPWDGLTGPTLPPIPWDGLTGPTLPPIPWDGLTGPTLPPIPWDGIA